MSQGSLYSTIHMNIIEVDDEYEWGYIRQSNKHNDQSKRSR